MSGTGIPEIDTIAENLTDKKNELRTPFRDKDQFDTFRDELIELCGSDWVPPVDDVTLDYALYSRLIESYPGFDKGLWKIYQRLLSNFLEPIFRRVLTKAENKFMPQRDQRMGSR